MFFSVCQLKKNHNKYSLTEFIDWEFEIGKLSDEAHHIYESNNHRGRSLHLQIHHI